MHRLRIAVTAGLVGLVATVALPGVAGADPVNISWAVSPSTQNGPDGRTHYTYTDVKPGTLVHDFVGITNYSTQPVTFSVYASDGITTTAGSIGLTRAKQKAVDVGAWLHTAHAQVTVPPKARVNEPITLTVPANATPGDHVGGVVASRSPRPCAKSPRNFAIATALRWARDACWRGGWWNPESGLSRSARQVRRGTTIVISSRSWRIASCRNLTLLSQHCWMTYRSAGCWIQPWCW